MNNTLFEEESKELTEDIEALKKNVGEIKEALNRRNLTEEEIAELPEETRKVFEEQKAIDVLQEEFEKLINKTNNYKTLG